MSLRYKVFSNTKRNSTKKSVQKAEKTAIAVGITTVAIHNRRHLKGRRFLYPLSLQHINKALLFSINVEAYMHVINKIV